MAIGNAAGYTAINSGLIGTNRARKLRKQWYAETILSRIWNRDYEGELKKQGDSVTVSLRPIITDGEYTRGMTFTHPTVACEAAKVLTIDTARKFEFSIEELDQIQSFVKGLKDPFLDDARNRMRMAIETIFLNAAPASAHASNQGATAGVISGGFNLGTLAAPIHPTGKEDYTDSVTNVEFKNAVDLIADMNTVLSEQNVDPMQEKWVVGPAWLRNRIAKSAIKDASLTGDSKGVIRGGPDYIGEVQGMQVYQSNLLTKLTTGGVGGDVGVFPVLFGVKDACSFAMQMESFWSDQLQTKQAWGCHGVYAFGWQAMYPEGLGVAYVTAENKL